MSAIKNSAEPKHYAVAEDCELLAFLSAAVPNAKTLLKHRAVSVDGTVVTQFNHRLRRGQTVEIAPENRGGGLDGIIFEDDEIIVYDKPAGLLSVASERGRDAQDTAYRRLTEHVRARDARSRIFVVHRLDRDTSGVLLAAKNEKLKLQLQDNWAKLVRTRGYTALVEGRLAEPSGTLRSWLRENSAHVVYESKIAGDGQEAVTEYRVLRENAPHSLLDIRLQTGRKNQIRVQMSGIGHPVAGDKKYGAVTNPVNRLALHAHLLELEHPLTHKPLSFASSVPFDL